jgi:hypothetical protein
VVIQVLSHIDGWGMRSGEGLDGDVMTAENGKFLLVW